MFLWAPLGILLVPLSGCGHSSTADEVPGVPVYSMVVASSAEATTRAFAAEIRPHHEALVGFRVPGKLLARLVELGTLVHKGDRLAQLDSSDLALEETSLASQFTAARSADDFLARELERYRDLRTRDLIGEAELDRHDSESRQAHERTQSFEAQLHAARNASSYATLRADRDGVVTNVIADPGQVVAAGQPVIALADAADREVQFDIPENLVAALSAGATIRVSLWVAPRESFAAIVRDIAPLADSATRTFRIKAVLPVNAPARLGMSATAYVEATTAASAVSVPASAILQPQTPTPRGAEVWIVDSAERVRAVPVEILEFLPHEQVAVRGLGVHSRIVTAGVQRLHAGERVALLDIPPTDTFASQAAIAAAHARLAKLP